MQRLKIGLVYLPGYLISKQNGHPKTGGRQIQEPNNYAVKI